MAPTITTIIKLCALPVRQQMDILHEEVIAFSLFPTHIHAPYLMSATDICVDSFLLQPDQ